MITFAGGRIGLRTFNHENMHQWWGDNVSEANFNLTFFKEGMATIGEYLFAARAAQTAAGGPARRPGDAAFQQSLVDRFNANYANTGSLWTAAPSDPTPARLFSGSTTYTRPGTAYLALRQILGPTGSSEPCSGSSATSAAAASPRPQLEAEFAHFLPAAQPAPAGSRLGDFFTQWFDTVYPPGGGANRPQLTGPGLDGPGFYDARAGARGR